MPSLKTLSYLHRLNSPLSSISISISISTATSLFSSAAAKMSSAAAAITTIEHVVLFKVRPSADASSIDAMISNLRSLSSLPIVSHLSAGPVLRHRSAAASAAGFTHLLHSRYRSAVDLAAYGIHPSHQSVVKDNVLPICDDIMAVDWAAELIDGPQTPPGSAMRLTLVKPREGAAKSELVAAISGLGVSPGVRQMSCGENFSPARAKGYDLGLILVVPGVEELDAIDSGCEVGEAQKEKVRQLVESEIVVDYMIVPLPSASL